LRLVDLQANPKSISHQPKHNSRVALHTQNRHPMTTTPVKSVCKTVIATSLRR
jgi:hypothetical protein